MRRESRRAHWEKVYRGKGEDEVSWFEKNPAPSLELIAALGATSETSIIDIGGGASRLVDYLCDRGFRAITVLDLSEGALAAARSRLGERAARVRWIVADVTTWRPTTAYEIWHDRAAFHFLTEKHDRAAYVAHLSEGLRAGGHAIIATFGPDGPERCSGLPVMRYSPESLAETLGSAFKLVSSRRHEHTTPWGSRQSFQFSVFRHVTEEPWRRREAAAHRYPGR
ncbi:class I SAM-dependent methyltransferase [Sinorhizobium psoraleae]|uniref:Class I SAM-dependent methyltransferase n=1 Tax=Sinorhizobium psoraleae TaxID=520838 RepID=A0ABT4KK52_9HYPH|nr:class I SAM-dependent methyltransferase [Sinorhizobium psoraleae]MCZ4092351.1 class I SAM-dependent methyltransferase [Sinorhizobium psoraleae]